MDEVPSCGALPKVSTVYCTHGIRYETLLVGSEVLKDFERTFHRDNSCLARVTKRLIGESRKKSNAMSYDDDGISDLSPDLQATNVCSTYPQ